MSFGSQLFGGFKKGLYQGLFGTDSVKDYKHATNTFLSDGYALTPQTKFLFHVFFNINTEIPGLASVMGSAKDRTEIGLMVKSAQLPSYRVDVETLNQYNRKRYVQQKINYDPVTIRFHDDSSDLVRSMWYNYYTYYFSDARHSYQGISTGNSNGNLSDGPFDFNRRDIYDDLRSVHDWGYNGESASGGYKPNFFKDIKIYGLNRGNFVEYTLINPIITGWQHDTFDYTDTSGLMSNQMTLQYETVKYYRGRIGEPGSSDVRGWGDSANYDSSPSKLSQGGGTQSIFGQGGLLDAGTSIVSDLQNGNLLGAALTAGRSYETFKDADLSNILVDESVAQITTQSIVLANSQPVQNSINNFLFPKPDNSVNASPLSSKTTQSNGGFTSATNWLNPNTGSTFVNTTAPQPTAVTSTPTPWKNPNLPTADFALKRYNTPADVSSNGVVTNNWSINDRPPLNVPDEQLGQWFRRSDLE